jgi:hypothetical protein
MVMTEILARAASQTQGDDQSILVKDLVMVVGL